jgi:DNA-binding MarR family transcriptional regulator
MRIPTPAAFTSSTEIDFSHMPGHMVRKLQQVQVALFMDAAGEIDLPPVQFAALAYVAAHPHTDQASLARAIAYDPVTIGGVIGRLEKKGWISRDAHQGDKRVKRVIATDAGLAVLDEMHGRVKTAQSRLMAPLSAQERVQWEAMMQKLLDYHRPISP